MHTHMHAHTHTHTHTRTHTHTHTHTHAYTRTQSVNLQGMGTKKTQKTAISIDLLGIGAHKKAKGRETFQSAFRGWGQKKATRRQTFFRQPSRDGGKKREQREERQVTLQTLGACVARLTQTLPADSITRRLSAVTLLSTVLTKPSLGACCTQKNW